MGRKHTSTPELAGLKRKWAAWLIFLIMLVTGGFLLLAQTWPLVNRLGWLGLSSGLLLAQLVFLWRHLCDNIHPTDGRFFSGFGVANWISLSRGAMTGLLAGFLAGPLPSGWLKWAPAALYFTSILLDYVDGSVARVTRTETRLGEWLDMFLDGQAVLFACALIVLYGQAPVWYLLVGLARYLYVAGEWLFRRKGWVLYPLPPNPFRRALAGSQMGFIAALLFPVFIPPGTSIAATLFMMPFLANFLRDWLWVSGVMPLPGNLAAHRPGWWNTMLPVVLRVLLAGLLGWRIFSYLQNGQPVGFLLVIEILLTCGVLLGALTRLVAMAGMLLSGFYLLENSLAWQHWLILLDSMALFLLGGGRFSLWKPEEWIIYHRPGDTKPS